MSPFSMLFWSLCCSAVVSLDLVAAVLGGHVSKYGLQNFMNQKCNASYSSKRESEPVLAIRITKIPDITKSLS